MLKLGSTSLVRGLGVIDKCGMNSSVELRSIDVSMMMIYLDLGPFAGIES